MKKIVYLCALIILYVNTMAQIDLNDKNWECVLNDDFSNSRWLSWNRWIISHPTYTTPIEDSHIYVDDNVVGTSSFYRSYISEWTSGVSRGLSEHQVYQRENCIFGDTNNNMRFVSIYMGGVDTIPLQCGEYDIPPRHLCDTSHHTLYYTSGKIESDVKYLYGYFEMKCSLPIHTGSFPAFWLYGEKKQSNQAYYNEIDIFEYSYSMAEGNYYYQFSCGIYCDNHNDTMVHHAYVKPTLPIGSTDLTHPHVFACEWLPNRVTWYVDGIKVNEEIEYEKIPHHPMMLKVNYAIDNWAVPDHGDYLNKAIWFDGDTMTIDYLKVYQLKTDCSSSITISDIQDLVNFTPSVKQSIVIEPSPSITIPDTTIMTMRASDNIIIKQGVTISSGAQITLIVHDCPDL